MVLKYCISVFMFCISAISFACECNDNTPATPPLNPSAINSAITDAHQITSQALKVRNEFLAKFANYLERKRKQFNPEFIMDFYATQCMDAYYQQMLHSFKYDIVIEKDLATLLKYIHIFNMDLTNPEISNLLIDTTKPVKKKD